MAGFILSVGSNGRRWYLAGSSLFAVVGIVLAIAGFASLGASTGIVGVVVAVASALFLADAIMNRP